MSGINLLKGGLLLILAGVLLLLLTSCQTSTKKPEIVPKIEAGLKGEAPTIHEHYDWVCGASDDYLIIRR